MRQFLMNEPHAIRKGSFFSAVFLLLWLIVWGAFEIHWGHEEEVGVAAGIVGLTLAGMALFCVLLIPRRKR